MVIIKALAWVLSLAAVVTWLVALVRCCLLYTSDAADE